MASTISGSYKANTTREKRLRDYQSVVSRYPNHVPVIVEPATSKDPVPRTSKYIIPLDNTTWGTLVAKVRNSLTLSGSTYGLTMMVNDTLIPVHSLFSTIYDKYKDDDGFLYVVYAQENTFG